MRWELPYPSRREPVLADNVVATSQPLAVQAGLAALRDGGNAVDAALAAAMTLTVVEPTSNGIGSDLFAIVSDGQTLHGINASGRSPAAVDTERLMRDGIALRGWDSVTVPGAVSGWVALHQRFARLDLRRLTAQAVAYARDGYAVGPVTARAWEAAAAVLGRSPDFAPFMPGGAAPAAGQRFAFPAQAETLELIAATDGAAFYDGQIAERITAHAAEHGAALSAADLAEHSPEWVSPLSVALADTMVNELPPNTQGLAALQALALLARTAVGEHAPDSVEAVHLQIEAMKLAFADAHAHIAEPAAMTVTGQALLDDAYLDQRAALIDPGHAGDAVASRLPTGGTVYLCAADASGMAVSLIQSNFHGFGSGIVVPGTGVSLGNRGAGFVTAAGHPNVIGPRKRPFHTIIPAFSSDLAGTPMAAFGVMGGHMQPQGHVQYLLRTALWSQNPQAALDAARWRVDPGGRVALEPALAADIAHALVARGHDITTEQTMGGFGGGQAVVRCNGAWLGASDPRKEGHAAGF